MLAAAETLAGLIHGWGHFYVRHFVHLLHNTDELRDKDVLWWEFGGGA
jgi:hypothetical protein